MRWEGGQGRGPKAGAACHMALTALPTSEMADTVDRSRPSTVIAGEQEQPLATSPHQPVVIRPYTVAKKDHSNRFHVVHRD